jgi:hypothetical protein
LNRLCRKSRQAIRNFAQMRIVCSEFGRIDCRRLNRLTVARLKDLDRVYEVSERRIFDWTNPDWIKVQNYVGVIQVPGLSIEILPKIAPSAETVVDPDAVARARWAQAQRNLLYMLAVAGIIPYSERGFANVEITRMPLLEGLISAFARRFEIIQQNELVGELLTQVHDLKSMVAQAVKSWNPGNVTSTESIAAQNALVNLEGAWSTESSNVYAKVVNGDLIVPYCFQGDNELTGVYFRWRKSGEYWFARYAWLDGTFAGFAFLKHESLDIMRGAWWSDVDNLPESSLPPSMPPMKSGVQVVWQRKVSKPFPP